MYSDHCVMLRQRLLLTLRNMFVPVMETIVVKVSQVTKERDISHF